MECLVGFIFFGVFYTVFCILVKYKIIDSEI